MTKLSVNVNKIATLRNSRGGGVPNLLQVTLDCEKFGAEGITVHPRPDQRHIRYVDVLELKKHIVTEFNIEGYPSRSFLDLVKAVAPTQVTLVPDPPEALTSNAGWNTKNNLLFLQEVVYELHEHNIRVSIFVDTATQNIEYAAETGADRIELYTEPYAERYHIDREKAVAPFVKAAKLARKLKLGVNAGHDLNLDNLAYLHENIPFLSEVSIGHALISDALYMGLENTIRQYKNQLLKIRHLY